MNPKPDDKDIESILKSQKIKPVPEHIVSRFTEEVTERIKTKPFRFPWFEWRPNFAFAPAIAIVLIACVTTFSYWQWSQVGHDKQTVLLVTTAPLGLEETLRLVEELEEKDAEEDEDLLLEILLEDEALLQDVINARG